MYVQRQISGFIGNNSYTDPVRYGIADRIWALQDVYPASIQAVDIGDVFANEIVFAAADAIVLPLPPGYVSTRVLSLFLRTTGNVRLTSVIPGLPTSKILIRAGTATDSNGFYAFSGRVTSFTVTNYTASSATVEYFCWQYPSDITLAAAWRDGSQTIGTAPSQ